MSAKKRFITTLLSMGMIYAILACSFFASSTATPDAQIGSSVGAGSTSSGGVEPPTRVPPPAQNFSLDNADKVKPEDVLNELSYSGAGGGGGPGECPFYDPEFPTIGSEGSLSSNYIAQKSIDLKSCGWKLNEEVTVIVELPDGNTHTEMVMALRLDTSDYVRGERKAIIEFKYSQPKDQYGEYKVTFSGKSGVVSTKVYIQSPDLKMEYGVDGVSILVHGLQPQERARVFLYDTISSEMGEGKVSFVAWEEFYADGFGEIQIEFAENSIPVFPRIITVIGDKSGIVPSRENTLSLLTINPDSSCLADAWKNYAYPTRLEAGMYAFVAFDPPLPNRVRQGPGENYKIIDRINPGVVFKVLDGPVCVDGVNWWKVKGIDRNFEGWTMEAKEQYYLVPCHPQYEGCP